MLAYRVDSLTKFYPGQTRPANDNISFEVREGEIFGILGDNGGGKSTLVKQMIGLMRSTSGRIELFGKSIDHDTNRPSLLVGYMPQQNDALNRLTVGEALFFTAHLRGMSKADARAERDGLLERLGLASLRDVDNARLSGGQRRLLRLAVAMAGSPPVLMLDEPTNNLDPLRRRFVWDVLRSLNSERGATVIFITHDAVEAEKVIQRIGILRDGRLVAMGRPPELKKHLGRALRVELRFPAERPPAVAEDGLRFEQRGPGHWVLLAEWADAWRLLESLNPEHLDSIRVNSPTLEDLYLHYVVES
jgi:ABC-type multidrug transport system ATPase subunit